MCVELALIFPPLGPARHAMSSDEESAFSGSEGDDSFASDASGDEKPKKVRRHSLSTQSTSLTGAGARRA